MDYSFKITALLLLSMLFTASTNPILDCGSCSSKHHKKPKTPIIPLPPIVKPPITLPPVVLPPIFKPPVTLPPVTLPPIVKPPVTIPPITTNPPKAKPCPPPPAKCPIDTLKLGACVDLLGGLVHIGLGDPVVNECCPIISGLVDIEAAVCLCTTLKLKVLNLQIFVPIALELLVTCGKTPPPGYTCSL
ncbi:hypothetical protein ACH5RR_005816 [Cinchona calisaya]|uniref:Bifunctional inhibitor/plant lipid transfer protein/seed storage helical domain-containing protein n=1 Tax=Cinchona calisaya TaxID=153742 RepID=A0ABD3AM77_9GENT